MNAAGVESPATEREVLEDPRRNGRLPIDRLRQGAATISASGEILYVNAAFAALLGVEVDSVPGKSARDLVVPGDEPVLSALLEGRSSGPLVVVSLERSDRSPLRVRAATIPLLDGHGLCLVVTGVQESDEDEALETVRGIRGEIDAVVVAESEDDAQVLLLGAAGRRYRQFVEHVRDGAVTLSPEGDVLYSNSSFAAMIGLLPAEIVGRRFADFVEERSRPLLDALRDGRRGPDSRAELTIKRKNGGALRALVTPLAPTDEYGVSLLVTDLTTRLRLEEAEQALRAIAGGGADASAVARVAAQETPPLTGAHRPYRVMVERMQQGAVTLSADGDVLYTNQPFANMLRRPLADLIGVPLEELVSPADRALLAALIDTKRSGASQGELTLLQKDGGRIAVLVTVALLPEEGGICLIVTDLTRQKAYEAMVAAQALERSILEQAVDAIVLCDTDGRVIRASRAALELCACYPLLLPFSVSFPLSGPSGAPDLDAVLRGAPLRGQEHTLTRAGSPDATVLLSAGPVLDADGRARGCVITITDITARRAVEDRLRESDRHKDEFLAILAHELRNPLAPIRTSIEILRTADLTDHRHASYAVDIIGRQTSNLIRLVDDLLDVNRINQGKVVLQTALIDMRSVVEQAVETCRPLISSRMHELVVRSPDASVPVCGDLVRLSQVVVNLLTNAANYTPPRGRIELALGVEGTDPVEAVVRVTDNGIGVPPDMLSRIFEPYQQASQTKERAIGGLGLGLTVSKRLMEMHGGSVAAFSDGAGRGSRFVARLALADPAATRRSDQTESALVSPPLRVLIVDDNRDAGESLARLMQMSNHDVQAVSNGAAAVAEATKRMPDVVLLDIGMPGMDGYEVARRLRELPGSGSLFLIAMTGYGTDEDRQKSAESGFDRHLVKPIDFAELERLLVDRA